MNWRRVKLGEFLKVRENRFKPDDEEIKGLKRVDKIDFSGRIYLSNAPSKTDMILVGKGDLLISGINVDKGAVAVYDGVEDVVATIHYSSYEFDEEQVDVSFLKLFLRSPEFLDAIKQQVPGGIKTEIKPKHLLPLEIVIPDLEGQREITNSLHKIEARKNELTTELDYQFGIVRQLRQAFLSEAMQGRLVAQDASDEPATVLLQKVKAEKENLIAKKKLKRDKPLPAIDPDEIPFEIPDNWMWCRLGEILIFGPANGFSPRANDKEKGIKCLTLTATTSGVFKRDYYKFVDVEIDDGSSLWLSAGDIVLQRGNSLDYVGIAALFDDEDKEFIYPDLMIKIRASQLVDSAFLHKVLVLLC